MSWEYLLAMTIAAAFLLPIVLWRLRYGDAQTKIIVVFLLHLIPYFLGLIARLLTGEGDLVHFYKLCFFQWSLTWISVLILFGIAGGTTSCARVYLFLFLSILFSGLLFLASPSLAFSDPFIGVIPGPFALDPIIDLHFFVQRLQSLSLSILIIALAGLKLRWRALSAFVLIFSTPFILDQIRGGANTLKFRYLQYFESPLQSDSMRIFIEKGSSLNQALPAWKREFEFHQFEILKRLPEPPSALKPIDIFLYQSDESKARLMGARQTQIGNFIRREMHLSSVELNDEILRHELVHLIHPSLNAPLRSFLDPLYFEGLAVALSSSSLTAAIREAAAIAQSPNLKQKAWPHGLNFYSNLPARASYRLAGGFVALNLLTKASPWSETVDFEPLTEIQLTREEEEAAREIFKQKPLKEDPLIRDCYRLYNDFLQQPDFDHWNGRFRSSCPKHSLLYRAIGNLSEKKMEALQALSGIFSEAQGDLFCLKTKFEEGSEIYSDPMICPTRTCYWKSTLIKNGLELSLKDILESPNASLKSILKATLTDSTALAELLPLLSFEEGLNALKQVGSVRKLRSDEKFEKMEREFYLSQLQSKAFDLKTSIAESSALLSTASLSLKPRIERLISRMRFEFKE